MSHPHRLPPGPRDFSDWAMALSALGSGLGFGVAGVALLLSAPPWGLLALGVFLLLFGLASGLFALAQWRDSGRVAAVRAHGQALEVTVTAARRTGMRVNKRRVVELQVRLDHPHHGEQLVQLSSTIPDRPDGAVAPGERIPARVHPVFLQPIVLTGPPLKALDA